VEAFRVLAYRRLSQIKSRSASFRMLETDEGETAPTMCKSRPDVIGDRLGFAYCDEAPALSAVLRRLVTDRLPDSVDEMSEFDALATQTLLEDDFRKAGIEATRISDLAYRGAKALEDIVDLGLRLKAKHDAEACDERV
ncbi:MAG: hypothetical protein IJZ10_04395, partial [Thermoguttaceae bacterium]|nr:hypothetical protein [Thermoguttaceae bacterium]